ncbi:DUF3168 domain-containing protein [Rhodobacteraceae bacterium Araon29]|tara:strand:- start:1377 stop:1787 length:411 start_codon:yes stop_codon:yes gene_type:complete
MSFANSAALQSAIYTQLSEDSEVLDLVGGHIYDAMPSGDLPELFISLGAEVMHDKSDVTGIGTDHDLTLSVITTKAGFLPAKVLASAVGQALLGTLPDLEQGRIVFFNFIRATARRDTDSQTRRIDMLFRARLADV